MRNLIWFLVAALTLVLLCGAAALFFLNTAHGFSARAKPTAVEGWVARRARALAIPKDAREKVNPFRDTPEVLAEARAHWADHCAVCHSNNGSGRTELGQHLYPPAPDMRQASTQQMTDAELFYVIENGIRLSGMPAWGGADHGEEDSWKLVRFIRHLPQVSAAEEREMEKLNPKGPEEQREEREEEEFLKGDERYEKKH